MSAIILQSRRVKGVSRVISATAIGPFESFDIADKRATELCRSNGDEFVYSVLSLVPPAPAHDGHNRDD